MIPLPIDQHLPHILEALRAHRCAVVVAAPGAGKTTRVPPAILKSGLLSPETPDLLVLQPRRIAARASAGRIAFENGWQIGREVGYHIRAERTIGRDTHLQVLTEAILTRRLVHDPFLEGVGCVVLDEFHERHIDSDLAIAMLREVRAAVREDLYVVVMSATIAAEPVSHFLGDCPIIDVPGRMFPVDLRFAPPPPPPSKLTLPQHIAGQISALLADATDSADDNAGDILVFLPGMEEIRRTARELEGIAGRHELDVLPLHGALSSDQQAAVLEPSQRRKVILATNIAETSLTIDGVRTVIDAGQVRVPVYDAHRGMDRLELKRISRASATQRMGRAGRTAPGTCIRLWSAAVDKNLEEFERPEIERVDLCSALLSLHEFGKSDPRSFEWFEIPPEPSLAAAERLLLMLGALDQGKVTEIGRRMLRLPVHPRLARLLLTAIEHGLHRPACTIATLLGEKDIMLAEDFVAGRPVSPRTRGRSDLLLRVDLLAEAERAGFAAHVRDLGVDPYAARHVVRLRDDLLRQVQRGGHTSPAAQCDDTDLLKLILLAYPDRVCRRRGADRQVATMVGGTGVKLHPSSVISDEEFFVAVDARDDTRGNTREAMVRIASAVEPAWLEDFFPAAIHTERRVHFDEMKQKAVGQVLRRYHDLTLSEQIDSRIDAEQIQEALADAVRPMAADIFHGNPDANQVLQRLAFVRKYVPEQPWPAMTEQELGDILADSCAGKRSVEQVKSQPLADLLTAQMAWNLVRLLDDLAPRTLAVPSGNRIHLDYDGDKPPVLAVRLQEVFGWFETPRIAGGRVPLLLHLLGPNFRPVQITSDLASFWKTTYFQVRKDLRIRYPKHSWPEDPLTAKAEAKGRPRQRP